MGSFGDIATLSFYPAHHITMGEGGAVFTKAKNLKRLLSLFVIGAEIVIVRQGKTIHAANVFLNNTVIYPQAMITNMSTLTWDIT